MFLCTADPRLSEPQCVSGNGKGVQISELFGELKPLHLYTALC